MKRRSRGFGDSTGKNTLGTTQRETPSRLFYIMKFFRPFKKGETWRAGILEKPLFPKNRFPGLLPFEGPFKNFNQMQNKKWNQAHPLLTSEWVQLILSTILLPFYPLMTALFSIPLKCLPVNHRRQQLEREVPFQAFYPGSFKLPEHSRGISTCDANFSRFFSSYLNINLFKQIF